MSAHWQSFLYWPVFKLLTIIKWGNGGIGNNYFFALRSRIVS